MVGVAKPTVGGWEARGLPPGPETLPRVVDFLGYSPDNAVFPAVVVKELIALRKRLRLPRSVMAERLGVAYATLWAWETGARTPRGPALGRVLAAVRTYESEPR